MHNQMSRSAKQGHEALIIKKTPRPKKPLDTTTEELGA